MVYVFICRKCEQSKWKTTPSTCRCMWSQKFSHFKNNNKSCNSGKSDLSATLCIIKQKWMRLDFLSFLTDDRNFCPPAFFVPFHIHDYRRVCAEANTSIWKRGELRGAEFSLCRWITRGGSSGTGGPLKIHFWVRSHQGECLQAWINARTQA